METFATYANDQINITFKLLEVGDVALWWDGETHQPYVIINEPMALAYDGFMLNVDYFTVRFVQPYPQFRYIAPQNQPIYFNNEDPLVYKQEQSLVSNKPMQVNGLKLIKPGTTNGVYITFRIECNCCDDDNRILMFRYTYFTF